MDQIWIRCIERSDLLWHRLSTEVRLCSGVKGMSDWLLGLTRCFLRVEWLPGDTEAPHQKCGYRTLRYIVTGGCCTVYYEVDPCFREQLSESILYSGKLSREKTFANFEVLWLFAKVFTFSKFEGVASFGGTSPLGVWHPLAAPAMSLWKCSPVQVSRYTVVNYLIVYIIGKGVCHTQARGSVGHPIWVNIR